MLVLTARHANGFDGFPLDDPWIHLTYARNLAEHHGYVYFPGERPSAGSTSPLYTLLLALGFAFTRNEKLLSYGLDVLFQLLFLATFAAWARRRLQSPVWAALAVLFVAFDARIGILSVSGMETSLLLFVLALAFLGRLSGRPWLAGTALGLAVWVRPDGLILLLVFVLDGLLERFATRRPEGARLPPPGSRAGGGRRRSPAPQSSPEPTEREAAGRWLPLLLPAGGLLAGYLAFNEAVGHTLLPNTFAAKTAYYAVYSRLTFLRAELVSGFTAGGWLVLAPLAAVGLGREVVGLATRRRGWLRPEAGWVVGLVLAYLVLLPYPHRFFRYLVPALPALALLGFRALEDLGARLAPARVFRWRAAAGVGAAVVLAAAGWLSARAAARGLEDYRAACAYHHDRHERTGRWLARHTAADAVVATHDVGAIAFYSRRRIVDIVGLVEPEAIGHLNRADYTQYLADLFAREKVTHLAVLRNWLEVANVAPLFLADPQPELMEVYPWVPGVTHLVPEPAARLGALAAAQLRAGNPNAAADLALESLAADSLDSRTWFLLGLARESAGRWADAARAYAQATALFPTFDEALAREAVALTQLGRGAEAIPVLERLLEDEPGYPGARDLYRRLRP